MRCKSIGFYLFLLSIFSFSCGFANAVTIDFDDINRTLNEEGFLTTEYEAQGVVFTPYASLATGVDSSQAVTGPWFDILFVGKLPTYVSFVLNHPFELAISVSATGPNGYIENILTKGWVIGMSSEELSTPYVPNQAIVLKSDFGISSIRVEENHMSLFMDNLTFHYATQSVPEPQTFILVMFGLAGVLYRRLHVIPRK